MAKIFTNEDLLNLQKEIRKPTEEKVNNLVKETRELLVKRYGQKKPLSSSELVWLKLVARQILEKNYKSFESGIQTGLSEKEIGMSDMEVSGGHNELLRQFLDHYDLDLGMFPEAKTEEAREQVRKYISTALEQARNDAEMI